MLSDARNRLSKVLSNKKFIVILVVTFIFIVAAVYTYRRYVVPRLKPAYVPNKEFTTGTNEGAGDCGFVLILYGVVPPQQECDAHMGQA